MNTSTEIFAVIAVFANLVSCGLSAYYWEKKPILRKLPICVPIIYGVIFHMIGFNDNEEMTFLEFIVILTIIGFVFYFSVWIQCRNKGDSFF